MEKLLQEKLLPVAARLGKHLIIFYYQYIIKRDQ
ncbi:Uncharacterised protein [Streptococcus pneumoniae]|nr:Uncharacterised protein [Streptococcus pneumoniae]